MPILILFIAIILVIAGINNQLGTLVALVKEDITPTDGSVSFGVWLLAIIIIGVLGYVKDLKGISNGFLILIFLGIILAAQNGNNNGFFSNLQKAFSGKGTVNTNTNTSSITSPSTISSLFNGITGSVNSVQGVSTTQDITSTDVISNLVNSSNPSAGTITSVQGIGT